ncbi:hypothetical protein [Oceanicola sp. 502str15]|uniref:hypothetical protein n=1 Tax=Oceanicola sp. 502str15 TaxID=2696061 RepID=UPI002095190D|nr:hypothetical protein [Oceanicola sp. 502str15]MCO6381326.1 hypothetical protein [Oceanicola sp. 502str15]
MPPHAHATAQIPRRPRAAQDQQAPWSALFFLSGGLPLIGLLWSPPQPTALFYTAYVALCALRWVPLRGAGGFIFAALLTGALIESLNWLGLYLRCAPQGHLAHPQLLAQLTLGFGFYLGGALAWAWLFRRYGFSTSEAFVIHGIMGISVAQNGEILLEGLRTLPAGALVWLFVYALYGCTVALPRRLSTPCGARVARLWWHYPAALAVCTTGALGGRYGWGWLAATLGALPAPRPICTAPFW